jgi:hypothetical protein
LLHGITRIKQLTIGRTDLDLHTRHAEIVDRVNHDLVSAPAAIAFGIHARDLRAFQRIYQCHGIGVSQPVIDAFTVRRLRNGIPHLQLGVMLGVEKFLPGFLLVLGNRPLLRPVAYHGFSIHDTEYHHASQHSAEALSNGIRIVGRHSANRLMF